MKHFGNYQREVDKGKLTAVPNLQKLTFRVLALRRSYAKCKSKPTNKGTNESTK